MDKTSFMGTEVISIVQTLKPKGEGWIELPAPRVGPLELSIAVTAWIHANGFLVLSAVEKASDPDGIDRGPEYHLSFSKDVGGRKVRVDSIEAKWLLEQFDLHGAEEDNHVPHGIVRNFWRPVRDDMVGLECACKDEEPVIRENKGDYIWRPA